MDLRPSIPAVKSVKSVKNHLYPQYFPRAYARAPAAFVNLIGEGLREFMEQDGKSPTLPTSPTDPNMGHPCSAGEKHDMARMSDISEKNSGRDQKGRFLRGVSGNQKGRRPLTPEMKEVRELCAVERPANVGCLVRIRDTSRDVWARIEAVKILLQYSDGKPVTSHNGGPLVNVNIAAGMAPITDPAEMAKILAEVYADTSAPPEDLRFGVQTHALEHQPADQAQGQS